MWIHEHPNWPDLTWRAEALAVSLADVRHRQGLLIGRMEGLLIGRMEGLGFELRREAGPGMLTREVVKSSAIEGETLDPEEVRSSIARRLGMDIAGRTPASRDVEGIVEIVLDAAGQCSRPLTRERLFDWHAGLFPTGRSGMRKITVGAWRTPDEGPMQVVSGPLGRENVHFEAPAGERLPEEMRAFLEWFDNGERIDPVLKAGIAHLWFVTIHPLADGNGRIARVIGDMALARAEGGGNRFYSLSAQMEAERKEYYNQLERQQRGTPDITNWLGWFIDSLGRAVDRAGTALDAVLFKARLWDSINQEPVNERQRLIINRMLEDDFVGFMNTSKYAKLAKCSGDTALRDIQILKERGIFIQNPGGGRSTSYRLPGEDA